MQRFGTWCGVLMLAVAPVLATDPPKPTTATVSCVIWQESAPIGVPVEISARVFNPLPGHEYEARYQYRVHTKKGEAGPILGTVERPNGAGFLLGRSKDGMFGSLNRFDPVDVVRGDLNKLGNMPYPPKNEYRHTVFLRVECFVFDITTNTQLTPDRPDAGILVLDVNRSGKVESVQSLVGWLKEMKRSIDTRESRLQMLHELDAYSLQDNGIARFYNDTFFSFLADGKDKKRDPDTVAVLLSMIRAMPKMPSDTKEGVASMQRLSSLAESDLADVKAAAKKKLEEFYPAQKK